LLSQSQKVRVRLGSQKKEVNGQERRGSVGVDVERRNKKVTAGLEQVSLLLSSPEWKFLLRDDVWMCLWCRDRVWVIATRKLSSKSVLCV